MTLVSGSLSQVRSAGFADGLTAIGNRKATHPYLSCYNGATRWPIIDHELSRAARPLAGDVFDFCSTGGLSPPRSTLNGGPVSCLTWGISGARPRAASVGLGGELALPSSIDVRWWWPSARQRSSTLRPTHRCQRRFSQPAAGLLRNLTCAYAALKVRVSDFGAARVAITNLGRASAERRHPKTAY